MISQSLGIKKKKNIKKTRQSGPHLNGLYFIVTTQWENFNAQLGAKPATAHWSVDFFINEQVSNDLFATLLTNS